jgi:hypothetical protein
VRLDDVESLRVSVQVTEPSAWLLAVAPAVRVPRAAVAGALTARVPADVVAVMDWLLLEELA